MKRSRPADLDADKLEELVGRIRGGDSEAFSDLYHACFRPLLYMLLRQRIPREHFEVEDVAQEVFLVAYRSIMNGTLRNAAALPVFLRKTAQHMVYKVLCRLGATGPPRITYEIDEWRHGDFFCNGEPSAQRLLEDREEYHRITQALSEMSAPDREIICRFYLRGEDSAQIMRGMHIDETAYRLRKSRAIAKLSSAIRKRANQQELEFQARRIAWRETTHREDSL